MADNRPIGIDESTGESIEIAPITTSAGGADANKLVQTNGSGKLDPSLFDVDILSITAGENITAPAFVTVDGAGEVVAASAASGGAPAIGFIEDNAVATNPVTVFFEGQSTGWAGLTAGAKQFLSDTTPGGRVDAGSLPTGNNELVQAVGTAVNATTIIFEPGEPRRRVV